MPLITLTQLRTFKPQLSVNSNNRVEDRYDSAIQESEFRDVRVLIGDKLYQNLINNTGDAIYQDLLNGGTYVFENFTYNNPGLYRVLAEFAFAWVVFSTRETMTPYGMGTKTYQDTQTTSRDRAKEIYKAQQSVALEYWIEVKNFLNRNADTYEYWLDCDNVRRNNTNYKLKHYSGDIIETHYGYNNYDY